MAVITVSRGTYSGGETVAKLLAERLEYQFLSREALFNSTASEYGIPIDRLVAAMEKPPSFWQQFDSERLRYRNYVRAALCAEARGGNLVYHGHAGHLVLAGVSHVIRVRVIADMNYRVASVIETRGLSRKDAISHIRKMDFERGRWARFLYGIDWGDSSLYDVTLNLAHMSALSAAEVVLRMVDLEEFKPTPQSLRTMDGLALGSRIWATLARNPRTASADLEVTAEDGVVTVMGAARSFAAIQAIAEVAGQVEGIRELKFDVAVASSRRE